LSTARLGLNNVSINDEISVFVQSLDDNMNKLDKAHITSADTLEQGLTVGETYIQGDKLWNKNPNIGEYVGWVNISDGKFALSWKPNTQYIIGDLVISNVNNGHVYQCITDGTSTDSEPTFPMTDSDEVNDLDNAQTWQQGTNYNVGDIVTKSTHIYDFYFVCNVAGLSGTTEPTWTSNDGTTVIDNSVTWLAHKVVRWKEIGASCNFRPFGKIE
jgi:hypothetical protein